MWPSGTVTAYLRGWLPIEPCAAPPEADLQRRETFEQGGVPSVGG